MKNDTTSNSIDPEAGPAVRRFRPGMTLEFNFFKHRTTSQWIDFEIVE
jgi:hypothetical protein